MTFVVVVIVVVVVVVVIVVVVSLPQPVPGPPTQLENCTADNLGVYANTQCDSALNNGDCNWDGGDCCPQTCDDENSPGSSYECGLQSDFDCRDPSMSLSARGIGAGCIVDTPSYVGDGYCDGEPTEYVTLRCVGVPL